jgi:hypothetical protein
VLRTINAGLQIGQTKLTARAADFGRMKSWDDSTGNHHHRERVFSAVAKVRAHSRALAEGRGRQKKMMLLMMMLMMMMMMMMMMIMTVG